MNEKNSSKKKYEALREELIEYIDKNDLKQNDQLPTVRDIIKNLGYSYATVNRTLIEMEQEGLITKRQGKGVFVDRSVPQISVKEVSLIIPKGFSSHKIFIDVLSGVRHRLEKAKISLTVSISNMSHEREKETIEKLVSRKIDGLIVFLEDNYRTNYSHIAELKERKIPFVLVDRYVPEIDTDYVVINNTDGLMKACSYLKYNRLCDRIILIQPDEVLRTVSSSIEKIEGYKRAIQILYGNEERELIMSYEELSDNFVKYSTMYKNLGICFNHDLMVVEFLKKLQDSNIELPENCHIFGYNNSYETPVCATVEQFNDQMGRKAAEILINKIKYPDSPTVHVKIEPKLILPDGKGGFYQEN